MSCCVQSNGVGEESLEGLLRFVVPYTGVPHDMALDMVRQAYIELVRRSNILIHEIELPIQKGVCDYELTAPDGYEVFAIKSPEHGQGYPPYDYLFPTPDRWYMSWGCRYRIEGNQWIIFRDAPSSDCGTYRRRVVVAVLPTECTNTIPRELVASFGKGIAAGAKASAYTMVGQPWYNPTEARRSELEFNRTALSAKNLMLTNRGARAPMFRPVRIL